MWEFGQVKKPVSAKTVQAVEWSCCHQWIAHYEGHIIALQQGQQGAIKKCSEVASLLREEKKHLMIRLTVRHLVLPQDLFHSLKPSPALMALGSLYCIERQWRKGDNYRLLKDSLITVVLKDGLVQ